MYVYSKIHLISTIRSEMGISLGEALTLVNKCEDAQVERAFSQNQNIPDSAYRAYAIRKIRDANAATEAAKRAAAQSTQVRMSAPATFTDGIGDVHAIQPWTINVIDDGV
jgi:hypothetical protein